MTTNNQDSAAVGNINDISLASEFLMCALRALAAGDPPTAQSVSEPLSWALGKIKEVMEGPHMESV